MVCVKEKGFIEAIQDLCTQHVSLKLKSMAIKKATVGMFDNSYFDNSKSQKTDYVRQLEGLVFDKKYFYYSERERERDRETI